MLIGIISDTHDKLETIDTALRIFQQHSATLVVHCGDWTKLSTVAYFADKARESQLIVRGVLGNNDKDIKDLLAFSLVQPKSFKLTPGVLKLWIDGLRLTAYHGHERSTVNSLIGDPHPDVLMFGHSHKPRVVKYGDRLIVNPGSTAFAIPRSSDWRASVALFDTKKLSADIIYLP